MEMLPCTYRISVKALVQDAEGKILLAREKSGLWEFPGGGLEHGELPQNGLIREITEETGYTIDWMSKQPVAFWTMKKDVGSVHVKWFAFALYEVRVSGKFKPSLNTNDAAEEVRFFSRDEATLLPLHDNTRPYFHLDT